MMLTLALGLFQIGVLVWTTVLRDVVEATTSYHTTEGAALCSLAPGAVVALIQVEQDTMLPHGGPQLEPMSATGVRPGAYDSLLASPATPMPAARVRLLELDSATRTLLAAEGISDAQHAFIKAAPYRADCRTVRYTDTVPFAVRGEVGYVRAQLQPRAEWVDGRPVFVIPDVWLYPYPRRRMLAIRVLPDTPLASAAAMFGFNAVVQFPRATSLAERLQQDSIKRERVLAWARTNTAEAELEPLRTSVRRTILSPDWEVVTSMRSRLRGSYRVDVEAAGRSATWYFRTHERPGYQWHPRDSMQTTAALLRSPYVGGYSLFGYVAGSRDSLPVMVPRLGREMRRVWLGSADRPTTPGNNERVALAAELEFTMATAPEFLWDDLDAFVPAMNPVDSMMMSRMNRTIARNQRQPRLPVTLRLQPNGEVRADTVLRARGRSIRIAIMRIDTIALAQPGRASHQPAAPRHFVFYGMNREALQRDSLFLRSKGFEGAQVAYSWRQLEPSKDEFDFALIREDLALLRAHGKKLWIQLQDVSFSGKHVPVPPYLVDDPQYHGGVARQYDYDGDDESKAVAQGWAMRRWDPAVQERFWRLLSALGREFDGDVAGINFAETSVTFGASGRLFPSGYSHAAYRDGVIANMRALKRAFPRSVTLVYGNFMPGEWRPTDNRGYLDAVYRAARELGVGVGGPDLLPHRRGQLHGAYPLIRESSAIVPTALAVQDGNLSEINPKTGQRVTASELLQFATNDLRLHYMFWGIEEPFYSTQIMPLINR